MVRPIVQETAAIEKIVHYSQFPREEGMPLLVGAGGGAHGEAPESIRRQRERGENVDKSLYCGLLRKQWAR